MKKILLGLLILLTGGLLAVRIERVNRQIVYPEIKEYGMGEEVEIGDDIFMEDYENMDGYSVTVEEAELLTYHEFLEKFQYDEETQGQLYQTNEMLYPEMVCNVKITVKNSNSKDEPDKGIDFLNYALYGKDFQLQLSELLYYVANPDMEDGLLSFRLMPGTEKEFYLPFSFRPSADVEPIQTEEVRNSRLYLPVCLYPEQRQIVLEGIDS